MRDRETSSGLRSRQSGIRYGLSGSGTGTGAGAGAGAVAGAGPEPVPGAEHLNPGPDGRDLGPENGNLRLHVVLSYPRDSATRGQTRLEFQTKSDPIAQLSLSLPLLASCPPAL